MVSFSHELTQLGFSYEMFEKTGSYTFDIEMISFPHELTQHVFSHQIFEHTLYVFLGCIFSRNHHHKYNLYMKLLLDIVALTNLMKLVHW